MQLFALDDNQRIISAKKGQKGVEYFCRECHSPIRLRGGLHTQLHFYHSAKSTCRQSQKSIYHIRTQQFIMEMIGDDTVEVERRFDSIGRIADVVWEKEKLIFEVQCSWIAKEEIFWRNKDYMSLGYKVIWILHEMRFNRLKPSGAEKYLQGLPHYFTNMDQKGNGFIYDQISCFEKGIRKKWGKLTDVRLDLPRTKGGNAHSKNIFPVPAAIRSRFHSSSVYFSGDFIDAWIQGGDFAKAVFSKVSERSHPFTLHLVFSSLIRGFEFLILRPYKILFNVILEKACK